MAPNSDAHLMATDSAISEPTMQSLASWLDNYGAAEYEIYQKETASDLSYDAWSTSEYVLGPYLFQLTLDVWDGESSNDEDESELSAKSISHGPVDKRPTKAVTTNGNGVSHPAKTPKSVAQKKSEKSSEPAKKRGGRKSVASASPLSIEDSAAFPSPNAAGVATPSSAASPGDATSSTAPRRGLRTRTPAQQRPYLQYEQIFEDLDDDQLAANERERLQSSAVRSKLSRVSFPTSENASDDETVQINGAPASRPNSNMKPKNSKIDLKPSEIPSPSGATPKKKRGRPRKHPLPENGANETPGTGTDSRRTPVAASPIAQTTPKAKAALVDTKAVEKPKRARKVPLSEEIVIDDDTTANEEDEPLEVVEVAQAAGSPVDDPAQKKKVTRAPRRKARKSAALITASDDDTTDGGDALVASEQAPMKVEEDLEQSWAAAQVHDSDATELDENAPPPADEATAPGAQDEVSAIDFAAQYSEEGFQDETLDDLDDVSDDLDFPKKTGKSPRKKGARPTDSDGDFKPYHYPKKKKVKAAATKSATKRTPKKAMAEDLAEVETREAVHSPELEAARSTNGAIDVSPKQQLPKKKGTRRPSKKPISSALVISSDDEDDNEVVQIIEPKQAPPKTPQNASPIASQTVSTNANQNASQSAPQNVSQTTSQQNASQQNAVQQSAAQTVSQAVSQSSTDFKSMGVGKNAEELVRDIELAAINEAQSQDGHTPPRKTRSRKGGSNGSEISRAE
ncbi:hypothetical protein BDV96DRAFT_562319 [Lophiotrema nucula]|uniref:Uncharacterized protein n=1 Tax=Lophiotrema nucula TaxID=690887 RepID=A0A6A5ZRK5_9PLEO|nr:hypothetical protein BDV96DRAFT_562319 [Lophiotrema nucula]